VNWKNKNQTIKSIELKKTIINQSRSRETGSRADLAAVLEIFQQSPLFFGAEFPSRPDDVSGS
jgi:hypothetical protein